MVPYIILYMTSYMTTYINSYIYAIEKYIFIKFALTKFTIHHRRKNTVVVFD